MVANPRRLVALVLLGLGAAALPLALGTGVDNRLERWVGHDVAEEARYQELRDTFGSDELLMVAITGGDVLGVPALTQMVAAVERLESVPGVVRVEGPPVLFRDVFGGEDPEALRQEVLQTPFYRDLFVSDDGQVVGLLVQVAPAAGPGSRRELIRQVRGALAALRDDGGLAVHVVGSTALIVALDEMSVREALRSVPIAIGLSLLLLAWRLRSPGATVAAAISCALTVVLTVAVLRLAGGSLSMVTAALPALLFVLALSNAIHILSRFQRALVSAAAPAAMRGALAGATRPCTLAALTTALGFVSLLAAGMAPVRELGVLAAVGLVISLAVNLTVTPELGLWLGVAGRPSLTSRNRGAVVGLGRPGLILFATLIAGAAAGLLIPRIGIQSNPLGFLPASHVTVRDFALVGERLTGFYTLEVVIETPHGVVDPDSWPVIDGIAARLEGSQAVARVLSPLDLLRLLAHVDGGFTRDAYRLPASRQEAERLVAGLDERGRQALASLVAPGGRTVRLSAVVNEMDEGRFLGLVGETRAALAALPVGYSGFATGLVVRLVTAQQALITSQLRSLSLALLVVLGAIWLGLKSLPLTLVSILPNLLPGVATFAAMGLFGVPLDAGTVMVASVALGIAVDNTIHLLAEFQAQRHRGVEGNEAVAATLVLLRPPMIATAVTACIGFAALTVSEFQPIRYFGLLAVVAMLVALAADLWLTPALLLLLERVRERRAEVQ